MFLVKFFQRCLEITSYKDIALEYLGTKISYGELFTHIDECVNSLTALNVKQGDIVTVALPSIPEALYMVYALNKMGAVANMIHPLAGEKEILQYLNEVSSNVAVIFEGTYKIVQNSIHTTTVKKSSLDSMVNTTADTGNIFTDSKFRHVIFLMSNEKATIHINHSFSCYQIYYIL